MQQDDLDYRFLVALSRLSAKDRNTLDLLITSSSIISKIGSSIMEKFWAKLIFAVAILGSMLLLFVLAPRMPQAAVVAAVVLGVVIAVVLIAIWLYRPPSDRH